MGAYTIPINTFLIEFGKSEKAPDEAMLIIAAIAINAIISRMPMIKSKVEIILPAVLAPLFMPLL